MKIDEWRMMESLREIFFKTGRMHLFDVRCSMFIGFFLDQTIFKNQQLPAAMAPAPSRGHPVRP
jgi:hypothetical protein